ncbi:MAG: LptA/OstA family protein [Pseudomonadales bacterium]
MSTSQQTGRPRRHPDALALGAVLWVMLLSVYELAQAEAVLAPEPPPAVQGGRVLLKDDDTVVVRANEVWEDAKADVLHFQGRFDMRTREWRILAAQATAYGAVNDPDRITVTGSPAKVWIERTPTGAESAEIIYGEGAELEYVKATERLLMRGDAVLIEQGNRLTSAQIEYDLAADRFKASGQQGVEIVVEAERAPLE